MSPIPWAEPYCGPAPSPSELWLQWNLDPLVLGALALGAAGLVVWRKKLGLRAASLGWLGLLAMAVAFVSPLCALSTSLFAARTAHHILLICVCAPLCALVLPRPGRIGAAVALTATALQAVVLWLWHVPAFYAAALSSDAVYALMEVTLFASALLFWCAVRASSAPASAFALVLTMVQMGMLGALLVFAEGAVYAPHALTTGAWGLSPLEDQQLAGLTMWAPGAVIYLLTALVRVFRFIGPDPEAAPSSFERPAT
jgi:putative membrane protein